MRKIIYFIQHDGFNLYMDCFKEAVPSEVSIVFIHSMVSVIQNIKIYFNTSALSPKLVQIRSYVINFLCKMQDSDLRIVNNRTMFEYIWSVVKEFNHFNSFCIDKDGLRIALKYFNSSTLTMRLSGLSQINSYISLFNELHHTASSNVQPPNSVQCLFCSHYHFFFFRPELWSHFRSTESMDHRQQADWKYFWSKFARWSNKAKSLYPIVHFTQNHHWTYWHYLGFGSNQALWEIHFWDSQSIGEKFQS